MPDDQCVLGYSENTAEPRSAAAGESVEIDASRYYFDGHQHAAFAKRRGDAGAWREDAITEIGVAGRESDDEASTNPGIDRNILGLRLVHRRVGEDEQDGRASCRAGGCRQL